MKGASQAKRASQGRHVSRQSSAPASKARAASGSGSNFLLTGGPPLPLRTERQLQQFNESQRRQSSQPSARRGEWLRAAPAAEVLSQGSESRLDAPEAKAQGKAAAKGRPSEAASQRRRHGFVRMDSHASGKESSLRMSSRPSYVRSSSQTSVEDLGVSVCIRVRPRTEVEADEPEAVVCDLDNPGCLQLFRGSHGKIDQTRKPESFAFDTVLPSSAGQKAVYHLLGNPVVQGVADGYHGCIFAYGQTGSGKSHTIFGGMGEARGLIPRISEGLFQELEAAGGQSIVKLSYLELYNEQARDLLQPTAGDDGQAVKLPELEIREHPQVGVFVEGLTRSVVSSAEEVLRLVDYGHKIRVVGCTNMNATSSRSHAIVSLHVERVLESDMDSTISTTAGQRVRRHAQLHAVDLAGSERMKHAGENQLRQRESKQINKSLLALGQMISKLAVRSHRGSTAVLHIPYRDSKLTFLLSQSLMGNCRTAMLACIAPGSSNLGLTESTLRFAASVKKIRTRPVRNEEIDGDLVRHLRAQIEDLQRRLQENDGLGSPARDIQDRLRSEQYLQDELGATFEEQQAKAKYDDRQRRKTLAQLGLRDSELVLEEKECCKDSIYVVNICSDPLLSGRLHWTLAAGDQLRIGSDASCEIRVDGLGVEPMMCTLVCVSPTRLEVVPHGTGESPRRRSGSSRNGSPTSPKDSMAASQRSSVRRGSLFKKGTASIAINNEILQGTCVLQHGDLLRAGRQQFFRIVIPSAGPDAERLLGPCPEDHTAMLATYRISIAQDFTENLLERLGVEKGSKVLRELRSLKLAVEEANEITEELRGGEQHELTFKEHLLIDPTAENEDLSLVVALRRSERPDDVGTNGSWIFAESNESRGGSQLLATWTQADFRHRLEVMHDLYVEVSRRDIPWGQQGDLDPWQADGRVGVIGVPLGTASSSAPTTRESLQPAMPSDNIVPVQNGREPELSSTTEQRPIATPPGGAEADSAAAALLQQLPLLQAELVKATEARDHHATELSSVRKELEELRLTVARQSTPRSPARRPGDTPAGNSSVSTVLCGASPSEQQLPTQDFQPFSLFSDSLPSEPLVKPKRPAPVFPASARESSGRLVHAGISGSRPDRRGMDSPNGARSNSLDPLKDGQSCPPASSTSAACKVDLGAAEAAEETSLSSPSFFALSSVLPEPLGSEDLVVRRPASAGTNCQSRTSVGSHAESDGMGSFLLARPTGVGSSARHNSPASSSKVARQSSAPVVIPPPGSPLTLASQRSSPVGASEDLAVPVTCRTGVDLGAAAVAAVSKTEPAPARIMLAEPVTARSTPALHAGGACTPRKDMVWPGMPGAPTLQLLPPPRMLQPQQVPQRPIQHCTPNQPHHLQQQPPPLQMQFPLQQQPYPQPQQQMLRRSSSSREASPLAYLQRSHSIEPVTVTRAASQPPLPVSRMPKDAATAAAASAAAAAIAAATVQVAQAAQMGTPTLGARVRSISPPQAAALPQQSRQRQLSPPMQRVWWQPVMVTGAKACVAPPTAMAVHERAASGQAPGKQACLSALAPSTGTAPGKQACPSALAPSTGTAPGKQACPSALAPSTGTAPGKQACPSALAPSTGTAACPSALAPSTGTAIASDGPWKRDVQGELAKLQSQVDSLRGEIIRVLKG
eukprot:TRINITY_DN7324_c0_g1_i1.p1 TRINITY_DN7324_c0_g1~~TRINITY_DN7324_c0_g1_i1.p1  ORF type:complete len:1649 (-),score=325.83 TRINITY_DN7324_c0_g1_i1:33-4979(-)